VSKQWESTFSSNGDSEKLAGEAPLEPVAGQLQHVPVGAVEISTRKACKVPQAREEHSQLSRDQVKTSFCLLLP